MNAAQAIEQEEEAPPTDHEDTSTQGSAEQVLLLITGIEDLKQYIARALLTARNTTLSSTHLSVAAATTSSTTAADRQ
jgi:hypothetical protein